MFKNVKENGLQTGNGMTNMDRDSVEPVHKPEPKALKNDFAQQDLWFNAEYREFMGGQDAVATEEGAASLR